MSRLLLALSILVSVAVHAQTPQCGVPPLGQPFGCELSQDYPPSVHPKGQVLDTSLVMRERELYVPVWTPKLCQGTLNVCSSDAECPGSTCVNAQTCAGPGAAACTKNQDCNTNNKCQGNVCSQTGNACQTDADCSKVIKCVKTWGWQKQVLRPYGSPKDPDKPINPANPDDPNLRWGYPGPILRARATTLKDPSQPPSGTNPVVVPGTRIKVKLYNYLTPQSYKDSMSCNPANFLACGDKGELFCTNQADKTCTKQSDCPAGGACLAKECTNASSCPNNPATGTNYVCVRRDVIQEKPNCFHGTSVTNLHLHGTHVSPQAHQDFVLLNLYPFNSDTTGMPNNEFYAKGDYQVDVNPLPWNQAPGTHWYHPHKHGSTSIQVQGGMAGGLIIEGAFDDWLKKLYGGKLVDRIMAIQQIAGRNNFYRNNVPNYPPQLLLNGYATPVITMRPGEIQRFRFVSGTTQAAAALEIGFDPDIKEVRQIAQDGIQFAWENYDRQPLRDTEGTYRNFKLAPGNRADFLVKAPDQPGTYTVNRRAFIPELGDDIEALFNMDEEVHERVPPTEIFDVKRPPVDQSGNPLLFTIRVAGTPNPMSFPVTEGTDGACKQNPKPDRCWPATLYYLRDLDKPSTAALQLQFGMTGNQGAQPASFWLAKPDYKAPYKSGCAGLTMRLGTTEDWVVANVADNHTLPLIAHPFHIHTNPFQVMRNADREFAKPYIWQDVIALPIPGQSDRPAGPIWDNDDAKVKCTAACRADNATWNGQWTTTIPNKLSVCGCVVKSDSVAFRHRFDDYTGAYVIHCHFLGHEDLGMMWNVQTVCPFPQALYGAPRTTTSDDCGIIKAALPACTSDSPPHEGH